MLQLDSERDSMQGLCNAIARLGVLTIFGQRLQAIEDVKPRALMMAKQQPTTLSFVARLWVLLGAMPLSFVWRRSAGLGQQTIKQSGWHVFTSLQTQFSPFHSIAIWRAAHLVNPLTTAIQCFICALHVVSFTV
jgi:hypothetical protein